MISAQTAKMSGAMSDDHSIIHPGSSEVRPTDRETQIAELLSMGYNHKRIAHRLGITVGAVSAQVSNLGRRIPGDGSPSIKVAVWYLEHHS